MSRYWSSLTRELEPYVPGEQPPGGRFIKLNTNENPYPPSPGVINAIRDCDAGELRLYPDPECKSLRDTIAGYYRVEREQVFVGNGSDEVLAFAFRAFFEPGRRVIFPDITYTFYPVYCRLFGLDFETVPLDNDFMLPIESFCAEGGGVLPNPNAPTGIFTPINDVIRILEKNRECVVILDEAYVDFGGESAVSLINGFDNLLVVQTASKARSLAGLRVGWALGQTHLVQGLVRIKDSFNSYTLDTVALTAAQASFEDEEYFKKTLLRVINTRDYVKRELERMGFWVCDSKANFVFATHPEKDAALLFRGLKKKGILVRYFDHPRISGYLRISTGTDKDMNKFLEAMAALL